MTFLKTPWQTQNRNVFFKYQVSLSSVPVRLVKLPNSCYGTSPPNTSEFGSPRKRCSLYSVCHSPPGGEVYERHACSVDTAGVRHDRGSGLEGGHRAQPAASGAPGEGDPRGAQRHRDSPPDRHQHRRVLPQTPQHRGQDHEAQRDRRGSQQRHGPGGQPWPVRRCKAPDDRDNGEIDVDIGLSSEKPMPSSIERILCYLWHPRNLQEV